AFASQSVMPALTRTVPRSAAVGQAAVPWGWPVRMGDLFKSRVGGRGALQIVDDGKMRGRVRYRVGLEKRRVFRRGVPIVPVSQLLRHEPGHSRALPDEIPIRLDHTLAGPSTIR